MATSYDETDREITTRFGDVVYPVKGDDFAFTYRLEPCLYIPILWCRLPWITDIQLKKLCEEALLEKEKTRHSFKYGNLWWTVVPDQKGTKVFRDTEGRSSLMRITNPAQRFPCQPSSCQRNLKHPPIFYWLDVL